MSENDEMLLERIADVFREVFDDDEMTVTREMSTRDMIVWDWPTYVTLLIKLERIFHFKFVVSEVSKLRNVGELSELIRKSSPLSATRELLGELSETGGALPQHPYLQDRGPELGGPLVDQATIL